MEQRSFLRHAAVYGLTALLVQAGGFILVPLYTHCLSPADYGVLEVLGRLAETVGICLVFGGMNQALVTFYQQSQTEVQRRRVAGTVLGLLLVISLAGGGVALVLAGPLSDWLCSSIRSDHVLLTPSLLRLAFVGVLLEPLCLIPLTLLQTRLQSTTYLFVSLGQLVMRVSLCVFFVAGLGWGVWGVVLATLLTSGTFAGYLCVREALRGLARPDPAQARALLRFACPFLPASVCFFILHQGDRFFLMRQNAAAVGIYAFGYKLAQVVSTFSLAPLYAVWASRMYQVARTDEAPDVFGRAFTRILAAYLFVGLGLILFLKEAVLLLARADYLAATEIVPPVLLACFCQASASLMDSAFYIRGRTGLKLGITVLATAIMLALYGVLIPLYGAWGAALATLGGFAFLALATWKVTQRIFHVRYQWPRLLGLVALVVALAVVGRTFPLAWWAVPVKVGLWLLAPLLAWHLGLISPEEKGYAHDLVYQLYLRFRGERVQSPISPDGATEPQAA
jgi:O-antigen/teichoic acid export membrane protein